ncbi:MAG: MOSC N-terminal beta barrel domain-containing protein [Candidatus Sericytochromatia bacterium]|nr:MOSC N-terminal beta barrel domain-containing protein [Candidatus Sericytochromatia bacterium]
MATSAPEPLHLSELWVYPLKSAGGIALQRAELTSRGLRYDRRWMLVDPSGEFVSQRSSPDLRFLSTALSNSELLLNWHKPGAPEASLALPLDEAATADLPLISVQVWGSQVAARCFGAEINAWFSERLQRPLRLVYLPESSHRETNPRFAPGHAVGFADGYPYLITLSSSLEALNQRLAEPVPMQRFRPNLVLSGEADPWAEDHWQALRLGDFTFTLVKPCGRCVIVGQPVLKALASDRKQEHGLIFGQNAVCNQVSGWLSLGLSAHPVPI